MRQALHIFNKDVRYLLREIALVWLIALAFALMHIPGLHASNNSWLAELAQVVTAAFLVGKLVLAEAIPGDRQFWITRPYRWPSLLGAKLLFLLTFVNLPVFLAHLFIVVNDGFPIVLSLPGMLWSQLLLFTFISLLFTALATLSAGLSAYIFAQLVILAAVFAVWQVRPLNGPLLGGVWWVRDSIAAVALAAIGIPVIVIQYRKRSTWFSRWIAIAGVAITALVYISLPWPMALSVQSHLSKVPALADSIRVSVGHASDQPIWYPRLPKISLRIPILVEGLPEGTEIGTDALTASIRAADGSAANLDVGDCGELKRDTISSGTVMISATCAADPAFFRLETGKPVTFRGSIYLTLFGNARSQTIPLSDQPANALDGLQCYTDVVKAEWDVYCRSVFRWPARLIFAKLGQTNANSFAQTVSYSPFPASLGIEPVETRWASAYAAGPLPFKPVRDVTIIVEEPLVHFRRDFETSIPLNEFQFNFPWVSQAPPQKKVAQ